METQIITAIMAVVLVPLVLYGYVWFGEWIIARLPVRIGKRMRPYVWVFPAVAFATVFMVLPTINTPEPNLELAIEPGKPRIRN